MNETNSSTSQTPNVLEAILPRMVTKRGRKQAHSPGRKICKTTFPQQLTDERFMSSAQKRAHRDGIEIWV